MRTEQQPPDRNSASLISFPDQEEVVTPMERVYTTIDKSGWGDGPWLAEPDKVQWKDAATGLPCLAVRQPNLGHWCGYVGVPPEHPCHGADYYISDWSEEEMSETDKALAPLVNSLEAHGGLTYAASCQHGTDESSGICHIPEPGEPDDVWWFGFDCAHSGDLSPYSAVRDRERGWSPIGYEQYRTLEYVRAQCASLAEQLATLVTAGAS